MSEDGITLKDAIGHLRSELRAAIADSDEDIRLRIDNIELQLNVEISDKVGLEAGASLWKVITAKVAAESSQKLTHQLTLSLTPLVPDPAKDQTAELKPAEVSSRRPAR